MVRSACISVWVALSGIAFAQNGEEPGAKVYKQHCAVCHDSGTPRIPAQSELRERTSARISQALTSGAMRQQAAGLTLAERLAVSQWLGRRTAISLNPGQLTNACKSVSALGPNEKSPSWTSWGGGLANWRFQSREDTVLAADDLPHLKLKWAFAAPNATMLHSQPAVYGGRLFFAGESTVYSLDASTGCTYWVTDVPASVGSGIAIGSPKGEALVFFGDTAGQVHALDAATGKPLWQIQADAHPAARVIGTPVYYNGRLYVPVSSLEEVTGIAPGYVCCTFRGSVSALDASSGRVLWKTFTIKESAQPGKSTRGGAKTEGPSGVGVWSAPTIDPDNGVLYVTTGDNYSDPPTATSDAVLALSLNTGSLLWSKQLQSGDAFNVACMNPNAANCPDSNGPDFDFGSSAILTKLADHRRVLILAQKSGSIYGVDPDAEGRILWRSRIGKGGILGGIEWGAATDGQRVYAALSDTVITMTKDASADPVRIDPEHGGGMFALRVDNGERMWMTPAPPCGDRRPCSPAQQAAVTAIPGAVFSGSLDGHIRAYSTADGKIIWDYDTVREYRTVDGVPGKGGSLDNAGPVIAGDMLFVESGYGQFGAMPGNVLLAFSVDGR